MALAFLAYQTNNMISRNFQIGRGKRAAALIRIASLAILAFFRH
jgi:hypothetical protein